MYEDIRKPSFHYLLLGFHLMLLTMWVAWGVAIAIGRVPRGDLWALIFSTLITMPWLTYMVMATRHYFVRFDGSKLAFGYNMWNVSFNTMEIQYVRETNIKWLSWGGLGWRIKGLRKIGYIISSGQGLEVQTTHKNRNYTFNCENPSALKQALAAAGVTSE